jgi:hypothetical protein
MLITDTKNIRLTGKRVYLEINTWKSEEIIKSWKWLAQGLESSDKESFDF